MKLPVDVVPSSEQPHKRFEQVLPVEMDETNTRTMDTEVHCVPKTEILSSTQGVTLLCEIFFHYPL